MTESSITLYQPQGLVRTYDEAERAASAMAKSGYFADSREAAQAVVKILAAQEMGFGAFAGMTGIYIVKGRPSIGANMMAAAVKRSGRYNYRVVEMNEKACEIEFTENGQPCGSSRFTIEDARKAGTQNLDKYPRNMLFARAMSNGVKWFCPDVMNGAPIYTPEELGATVNEDGDVIDVSPVQVVTPPAKTDRPARPAPPTPKPTTKPEPTDTPMTYAQACDVTTSEGKRYGDIDSETLSRMSKRINNKVLADGTTPEEKAECWRKLNVITIILDARQSESVTVSEPEFADVVDGQFEAAQ